MKKAFAILLTACLLASLGVTATSATVTTTSAPTRPDWVITEICPDQAGDGTGGWSDGKDCMEFIEIYNNSGITLNLYDYCMTYNGNARTNEKFETQIVEITPFKAGDYLDGSNLPWSGATNDCGDLSNKPVNPDTCMVAPGEVVVLWVMYHEAYYALWNEGKGMSMENFRSFWGIPEGVKVIAVDGSSNTDHGGHDKNFNVKNSATGTYGIALYSEALNTAANTTTGGDANYPVIYTESPELSAWATVCFTTQLMAGSIANYTYNFAPDYQGIAAAEWGYVADARRMLLVHPYVDALSEATVGKLLPIQKLILGAPMEAGETCEFADDLYIPDAGLGDFEGFIIGDTLYKLGTTFKAEAAGTYTLQYKYKNDTLTYSKVVGEEAETTTTPPDTTTPPETSTGPTETTTEPTEETTTEVVSPPTTEPPKKESCKSVVGLGFIATLIPAALVITKKKRH